MTLKELEVLKERDVADRIESCIDEDPVTFALRHSRNGFPAALVSIQLKNLRKCRTKLPAFYSARCILPTQSLEQSSSQRATAFREYTGNRCLDLCTGLGADAVHFSENFAEVVTVEQNPVLVALARENFHRLGKSNLAIIEAKAEDYLRQSPDNAFDLIFIDPDRRTGAGRGHTLEAMQPNLPEILPDLLRVGKRVMIKLSPLFDLAEIERVFPQTKEITIISINNEVKEVLVTLSQSKTASPPVLTLAIDRLGFKGKIALEPSFPDGPIPMKDLEGAYIFEPDVAFYKANGLEAVTRQLRRSQIKAWINHRHGYIFSREKPGTEWPGHLMEIKAHEVWSPKKIRKILKAEGIGKAEIRCRFFPKKVSEIRKLLKIEPGGDHLLLFTRVQETPYCFWVRPLDRKV